MIMKIIQIKICGMQLKAMFREIFINNSFGGKKSKINYLGIRKFKKEQQMEPKESKRRK